MTPNISQWSEWLTISEAAQYLSTGGAPVSDAEVLRLVQEGVLHLSVRFLDTIYGEYIGVRPPYDEGKDAVRHPLPEGAVFDLPMTGAARLAVEETRRRHLGQDQILNHTDAMVVDDDIGNRFRLHHRLGDYSPVTRLPEHAVLLMRREVLERVRRGQSSEQLEKPLDRRERDTLDAIIAAAFALGKLDIDSKIVAAIVLETSRLGHPVAPRTVQAHLSRVREQFGRD